MVTFPLICIWYLSTNHHSSSWYNHCWIPQFLIMYRGSDIQHQPILFVSIINIESHSVYTYEKYDIPSHIPWIHPFFMVFACGQCSKSLYDSIVPLNPGWLRTGNMIIPNLYKGLSNPPTNHQPARVNRSRHIRPRNGPFQWNSSRPRWWRKWCPGGRWLCRRPPYSTYQETEQTGCVSRDFRKKKTLDVVMI